MMKVVYFNQWFSSITEVIKDLKERNKHNIKIIASSKNKDHAYKDVVDEFIIEDWEETSNKDESMYNYMNWLVKTCNEYKVDIFFAKKYSETIAKNISMLNTIGVFTVLDDYSTLLELDNKARVYEKLSVYSEMRDLIPDYFIGTNADYINNLIDQAADSKNTPWCFKLNSDEGGASFRQIEQRKLDLSSLSHFRVNCMGANEAKELVNSISKTGKDNLKKLLFMELLDSPEISVDCYNSKKGFIAICREKISGTRVQRIYYSEEITHLCKIICSEYKLRFPFNVQFRIKHNEKSSNIKNLRLLEINPRMSGGTYYSTLFDMNICNVCLADLLHLSDQYNIEDFINFEERKVSHVEQAIIIK